MKDAQSLSDTETLDPMIKIFTDEISSQSFAEYLFDACEYIAKIYGCNFTQFLSQITYPEYLDPNFWDNKREDKIPVETVIDDIFCEMTGNKRKRAILGNRY